MKSTVSILVERYAYPRVSARFDIPARFVGRLAVHRSIYWGGGDLPTDPTELFSRKGYQVTHIASGLQACPPDVKNWLWAENRQRLAIDFAERWQAACPEFFEAIAVLPDSFFTDTAAIEKRPDIRALMIAAIDKARGVKDELTARAWDL